MANRYTCVKPGDCDCGRVSGFCLYWPNDPDLVRSPGDPHWLQAHAQLVHVHEEKSSGYGTGDDPLANYVAVGYSNGRPPYMYALDRMTEKITRCQSLQAQGRTGDLEEEFLDLASLALCAEALRRRTE